jgi:DNA-binding NtrC family response regulator
MVEGRLRSARVVGASPKTHQVLRNIEKVSRGRWPVLILGETGTGKEVAARSLHEQAHPGQPFVTIDCSSLVGPLMESELFGHTKGAFTGATGIKVGLIEAANGGSAFFDEIGELPLDVQSKLLRVLQEKEFRPVGSISTRRSDFRIIAATNRDLSKEVERGTFRRDLYYRLNVVTIKLSPLRERREDILPLAEHFLGLYGKGHLLTQEALDFLVQYDWPGNVRELENCVQQMVAINTGPLLHVGDLPSAMQNHLQTSKRGLAMAAGAAMMAGGAHGGPLHHAAGYGAGQHTAGSMLGMMNGDVPHGYTAGPIGLARPMGMDEATAEHYRSGTDQHRTEVVRIPPSSTPVSGMAGHKVGVVPLELVERQAILSAIEHTNGDRGQAANLLGIGRTTLYRKLKEYGLAV